MGRSKVWLRLGDEYLLQRMVRIVAEVAGPVVVAGLPGQDLPPLPDDIAVVFDAIKDGGPLAGLAAGFDVLADRCDAVFVVSCDQPLLRPALIRRLIELLGDHDAVAVRDDDRLHPLTAVYRIRTRTILDEMRARGDRRVTEFARQCDTHIVSSTAMTDADPTLASLTNVNDPDAFDRARRELGL